MAGSNFIILPRHPSHAKRWPLSISKRIPCNPFCKPLTACQSSDCITTKSPLIIIMCKWIFQILKIKVFTFESELVNGIIMRMRDVYITGGLIDAHTRAIFELISLLSLLCLPWFYLFTIKLTTNEVININTIQRQGVNGSGGTTHNDNEMIALRVIINAHRDFIIPFKCMKWSILFTCL